MTTGLSAVEAWDLPALQGSAAALADVPTRLTGWRDRVDGLRTRLRQADLWSGPAADVTATALVELSAVAAEVVSALAGSADELATVVARAGTAQDEVAAARACAASGPVVLSDDGVVAPVAVAVMAEDQLLAVADRERAASWAEAHARSALAAADGVLVAARGAGHPLVPLDVGSGEPGFGGVALAAAAVAAPPVVPVVDPAGAAAWWDALTPAARQAVVTADPAAVGALDGLPAGARDQANRLLLDDALAHPTREGYAVARATADQLAGLATAQLLLFVPGEDLVALSVGDLDTAGAVGVLVPGMNTTPAGDLDGLVGDAVGVGELAAAAAPGLAVATLVWLGYQTPGWGSFFSAGNARSAGPELARTLDGLAAARAAGHEAGGPVRPRTTVVAHSYGTLVAGEAARAAGGLAADAVVLLGSPGTGSHAAAGLEAREVYGAWSPADPVSSAGYYGGSPFDSAFGDTALPVDPGQGHTEYLDPDHPTLQAVAEVVAGPRGEG